MRILAVMRHDDGLARRLQSPIGKAANEIRRRYALWFLCRRHAPPPIYRDLPTIVGLAGMIWRAIMYATAPLGAGSDQPPLYAAQRGDPRIGRPQQRRVGKEWSSTCGSLRWPHN